MFLYKLPDETPANRKMAKQIVERWSRPIFDSHRDTRQGVARQSCQHLPQTVIASTDMCLLHCCRAMLDRGLCLLITALMVRKTSKLSRASLQG